MSKQVIDLHEELAEAKVGKFHWRLGAMMGLLTLFDGYDTFNPAYVIHYVAKPWGLQPGQAGLLISSGLVGFLIGAAIHGIIADRLGRLRHAGSGQERSARVHDPVAESAR
jgi:AAHS family 4-hydroxybenzoate transporter-like MFS transporter